MKKAVDSDDQGIGDLRLAIGRTEIANYELQVASGRESGSDFMLQGGGLAPRLIGAPTGEH
jgi:hypothetical protein